MTDQRARRRLSYSQGRVFRECRQQYRYQYLERREQPRRPYLDFGSLFHAAAQAYLDHLLATRQELAPQDVPAVWAAFQTRYVLEYGEAVPDDRATECRQLLEKFAGAYRLDLDATWKTEAGLGLTWEREPCEPDDPAAGLIAYLDLVKVRGWRAEIDDWKSGRVPISNEALSTDPQARLYAMILHAWNPALEEIAVSFFYPRWTIWRSTVFTRRDCEDTWQEWLAFSDSVEAALSRPDDPGIWKPTPGTHCGMCAFSDLCPIGLPRLKSHAIMTMADRQEIAETLLVAEQGIKLLKARLRKDVEGHGAVKVADGAWDLWKTERVEWNVHRAIALAPQFHVEPTAFLRIGADEIKKVGKHHAPFVAAVRAESLVKESLEFKFKKFGGEDES